MTGPAPDPRLIAAAVDLVMGGLAAETRRPLVLGICGAQGSGKSTLAGALAERLAADGLRVAVLSLDDLYCTRADRQRLARVVHPLLATRGVPGTHDVAVGMETLAALDCGDPVPLPRFDKATDDRVPAPEWSRAPRQCQVLVFEGWCVGARAQAESALAAPVNALESQEDPDGVWRRHVNAALATAYAPLFGRIDRLLLLAAPGFEAVFGWRRQQEEALRARTGGGMDDAALLRFIGHYERLTRHILQEMPARADCTACLDKDRNAVRIESRR